MSITKHYVVCYNLKMEEFIFLDDIATADVAIESRGDTPEELFSASARATFEDG